MLTKAARILNKCIDSRLATSFVLVYSLLLCNTVLAEYKPPSDQKPPTGRSESTTIRGGCSGDKQTTLTALAPQAHTGQTTSLYPTFAWFVPDTESYPIEFQLYRYAASGKHRTIVQKIQLQSQPGIMSLSLPPDTPHLVAGQRYGWQVVLLCNPNRPSSALVTGANLDVVAMPNNLANALATTNNPQQKINLYASAGLWYDALSIALTATESKVHQRLALELLEDLAKLEETREALPTIKYSTRIRHIIEREQRNIS